MKRQKILHVLYSGLGGTTDYVFSLIEGDKKLVFEHCILFYGIEEIPKAQLFYAKEISSTVIFIPKKPGYDKSAYKNVLDSIIQIAPISIVLHVNSLVYTCAKYKKAKLVFVEHQANHLKTKKEWIWSILGQQKSNHVISFTNDYLGEIKRKLFFFYMPKKNTIIRTGIDLNKYSTRVVREESVIRIGIISRINSFRDHKTLLISFQELNLSNVELYIAGDGPLKNELKDNFQSKNIHWLGTIGSVEIVNLLKRLDIYVIASFGESTSIALMQAQASGLPIIATNAKGISNVLTDRNCVFVEPKSVLDYKNALELLINNVEKRNQLATKSLEYANKNLSHMRMFDEYKKLLK